MKFSLETSIRPHLLNLKPYSSARDEYSGKEGVFLDANENPFEREYLPGVNRYPDPYQLKLKQTIAPIKGVAVENIFLGNGSDEAIDLLIRAFCEPGKDGIIILPPTYGMYEVSANIHNARIKRVNLTADFQLDVDAILEAKDDHDKILFICSPNNPSGNLVQREAVFQLLKNFAGLVVLDEAYIDFCPEGSSFTSELANYPNLVVMQTFSKGWGMAGLRLGLAYAQKPIIDLLNKLKAPYNINLLTQNAALEALHKSEEVAVWVNQLLAERAKLTQQLQHLKFVHKVYPSDANFLLVKMDEARHVYETLLKDFVIVRDRSKVVLCDDCLRITVGSPKENEILLNALKKLEN